MLDHRTQVRVRFGDTDPYGVVYFVSYFRYCHRGIEEFLRHLDLPPETIFRNRQEKFGLPIVAADCRFLAPARYGDLLEMETSVKEVKEKVLVFRFRFYLPPATKVIAEGTATLVAIDHTWKSRPLPEVLRDKLEGI
ncbi:MAG: acyl-CoA thioesterase [Deltaproteobacteria bacterium]|nr:acyl-CoA thioesterase [Deltaproteobacteria bacterium]MBW2072314.1 acyl-CoA thioesterase [Deltaproteobacteria bacterium]